MGSRRRRHTCAARTQQGAQVGPAGELGKGEQDATGAIVPPQYHVGLRVTITQCRWFAMCRTVGVPAISLRAMTVSSSSVRPAADVSRTTFMAASASTSSCWCMSVHMGVRMRWRHGVHSATAKRLGHKEVVSNQGCDEAGGDRRAALVVCPQCPDLRLGDTMTSRVGGRTSAVGQRAWLGT